MKKLVFILMAFMPATINAQRIDKPSEKYDVYCVMSIVSDASIRIGESTEEFKVLNDDGTKLHTSSPAIPITYMEKRGWKFVQFSNVSFSDILFKKEVTKDEEAYDKLNLIYLFGKNKGKRRDEVKEND